MQVAQKRTNGSLAELQTLLYRLIAAPEGVAAGLAAERERLSPELDELLAGDNRLTPTQRLEIYANAYFYRILDCLKDDFPATLATVGADNFHNLITGYLIAHPPTRPSIAHAGDYLPEFLRDHPMREEWPFLADLARLEGALLKVFHAANAEELTIEAMRSVPAGQWPALRMRTHPAVVILDCEWRVDELLRDFEKTAGANVLALPAPVRERTSVLVWRQSLRVHYRRLEDVERAALGLAREGAPFTTICDAVAAGCADENPVGRINELLTRWLSEGLLLLAADELRT
ncbi:MAG TPA: DNA-binding domain-containing protein [Candidatus Binataceae bacterium]|nr:DNA-binding domain-containing protein [Candidatus Binataceae bacterium]